MSDRVQKNEIRRKKKIKISQIGGYTLVEMVLVIIILGILAAVAFQNLGPVIDIGRTEETKKEMEQLAFAIAGNPNLISGGVRTDFGYVGDIGALPSSWDNLVTNPGYATWDGPYVQDDFGAGATNTNFKLDGWGSGYSSPGGNSFCSTGGPHTITRTVANSAADLLYNSVTMAITDLNLTPPGTVYKDSVKFLITFPDGAGSTTTVIGYPASDGLIVFDSIPVGIHTTRIIYIPDSDTLTRKVNINPGHDYFADIQYYADVW